MWYPRASRTPGLRGGILCQQSSKTKQRQDGPNGTPSHSAVDETSILMKSRGTDLVCGTRRRGNKVLLFNEVLLVIRKPSTSISAHRGREPFRSPSHHSLVPVFVLAFSSHSTLHNGSLRLRFRRSGGNGYCCRPRRCLRTVRWINLHRCHYVCQRLHLQGRQRLLLAVRSWH
jgi:hypothetical protein